jgi:hypothetical protein
LGLPSPEYFGPVGGLNGGNELKTEEIGTEDVILAVFEKNPTTEKGVQKDHDAAEARGGFWSRGAVAVGSCTVAGDAIRTNCREQPGRARETKYNTMVAVRAFAVGYQSDNCNLTALYERVEGGGPEVEVILDERRFKAQPECRAPSF